MVLEFRSSCRAQKRCRRFRFKRVHTVLKRAYVRSNRQAAEADDLSPEVDYFLEQRGVYGPAIYFVEQKAKTAGVELTPFF